MHGRHLRLCLRQQREVQPSQIPGLSSRTEFMGKAEGTHVSGQGRRCLKPQSEEELVTGRCSHFLLILESSQLPLGQVARLESRFV